MLNPVFHLWTAYRFGDWNERLREALVAALGTADGEELLCQMNLAESYRQRARVRGKSAGTELRRDRRRLHKVKVYYLALLIEDLLQDETEHGGRVARLIDIHKGTAVRLQPESLLVPLPQHHRLLSPSRRKLVTYVESLLSGECHLTAEPTLLSIQQDSTGIHLDLNLVLADKATAGVFARHYGQNVVVGSDSRQYRVVA